MFLLEWYREFLEIRYESKQRKVQVHKEVQECQSCETLRKQLEIANYEKGQLLTKLLKEPEKVPERSEGPLITPPKTIPWAIRRQMLEREDREKAALLRNVPKPSNSSNEDMISTEEFEQELKNASTARESQKS